MRKFCPLILLLINLFLISNIPALAQTATDPYSIKLKSFTPPPTKTPTATRVPTRTPTRNPTAGGNPTRVPTIPGADSSCQQSNRGFDADCAVMGKPLLIPKPRYLIDTSLCTEAYLYPGYKSTFFPPDLIDLHQAIGDEFWIRGKGSVNIMYNKCKVDDLADMLAYIEKNYTCISFVGYGYRSYAEQQSLWNSRGCDSNPNCGVATPGWSLHQGGIAVDLFCMEWDGTQWQLRNIPDTFSGKAIDFNFDRPLRSFDPPHFDGL